MMNAVNPMSLVRRWAVLTSTCFAIIGCKPAPTLTPQEQQNMDRMTQNPVTWCVGRYLIDIPDHMVTQSRWDGRPNETVGHYRDGVSVQVKPMERSAFDQLLRARHEELKVAKFRAHPEWKFLESATPVGNADSPAMLFNFSNDRSVREVRRLEIFGWKNGYQIVARILARELSYPETLAGPFYKGSKSNTPQKLTEVQGVYARVRGRSANEVPTDPGICIHNGFISDTGRPVSEKNYKNREIWYSKAVRGLLFFFETEEEGNDDTLLDRVPEIERDLPKHDPTFRVIRKKERKDAGEPFVEWLTAGRTDNRVAGHLFIAEGHSLDAGLRTPFFRVNLDNGKDEIQQPDPKDPFQYNMRPSLDKAPLTEAEALAFWDTVTKTIRLRPGAF